MGYYVEISCGADEYRAFNLALRRIVAYIGRNSPRINAVDMKNTSDYEKGVDLLNRRMKKWCKRSIYRLIYAEKKNIRSLNEENTEKFVWHLHKYNAWKLLRLMKQFVFEHQDEEMQKLFDDTYQFLRTRYQMQISNKKSSIIQAPYGRDLDRMKNSKDKSEKRAASKIKQAVESFDDM